MFETLKKDLLAATENLIGKETTSEISDVAVYTATLAEEFSALKENLFFDMFKPKLVIPYGDLHLSTATDYDLAGAAKFVTLLQTTSPSSGGGTNASFVTYLDHYGNPVNAEFVPALGDTMASSNSKAKSPIQSKTKSPAVKSKAKKIEAEVAEAFQLPAPVETAIIRDDVFIFHISAAGGYPMCNKKLKNPETLSKQDAATAIKYFKDDFCKACTNITDPII